MSLRDDVKEALFWARSPRSSDSYAKFHRLMRALDAALLVDECVCNVGVQECAAHPGRLLTQEEKIEFRKAWDARVASGVVKEP